MATERRVVRVSPGSSTWTPAQILALILGVGFVVLGGVALLRTGIGPSLFEPTTSVAGFAYTPLLAIIELVLGLLLLAVGAFPQGAQGVVFLGVLMLAFGLLLVIEPGAFQDSLAAGRAHGWLYVIAGGTAAIVGMVTPAVIRRTTTTTRAHPDRPTTATSRTASGDGHPDDGHPDDGRTRRVAPDESSRTQRLSG